MSSGDYYALAYDSQVQVRYLPDDPGQARLTGTYADDSATLFDILGVLAAIAIPIILFGYLPWYTWRNYQLAKYGRIVNGTIVDAQLTRSKSTYTLRLSYQFTSPISSETLMRTESRTRNDLQYSIPTSGTPVQVLFLKDDRYRVL